jgi:glycosyltransferase involved in cell wall biosynthesis
MSSTCLSDASPSLRVVFLIRSLQPGGAERQLVTLSRNLNTRGFSVTIVTFYPGGLLENDLHDLPNVQVVSANKRGRWDIVGFMWRLLKLVRKVRPHIIHGYLYGANEVALIAGCAVHSRVAWGVRSSALDMRYYDWLTRILFKIGARLSPLVDVIIANSEAGHRSHLQFGYPARRFVVIPNGINTDVFCRDTAGRQRVRMQWNIREDDVLIGIVARIDPMKDHETFLRAAANCANSNQTVRFVAVGQGADESVSRLKAIAERLGIARQVVWAGARQDMAAVYSAIDIVTSSSAFGEGFSNCLAEAMACEANCVATDVGDARIILGDAAEYVSPKEPEALALAWQKLLAATPEQRAILGRRARARIVSEFSVEMLASRTAEVLRRVVVSSRADSLSV